MGPIVNATDVGVIVKDGVVTLTGHLASYAGPLPEVCQIIVIADDAMVDDAAKGKVKVRDIIWNYNTATSTLWPEIVCIR